MPVLVDSVFHRPIYLGAATRTPIGKFGGSLKKFTAPQLGTLALSAALKRAPEAPTPDWVLVGHARQAGAGPNPARQICIFSGLPDSVPALTLNQACASGMTAVFNAMEKIAMGKAHSIWAGGTESMSNTPYLLPQARWGLRLGHSTVLDGMVQDGFHCPMADMVMGETVERFLAQELGITRQEQDEYALSSQTKAELAWKSGAYSEETFSIETGGGKSTTPLFSEDEHRRPETTLTSLGRLTPVFDPKNGTITAGNSSGITDGAAFLHVSDQRFSHAQAEILDFESIALDPKKMGLGPIQAIQNLISRHKLSVQDLESVEINEAFAAQVLACQRILKIPPRNLNPRGGAIAIGHPIGASGARVLVTLLHTLKGKKGALGVAALCVSGGQGTAVLVRSL
ncbi:MAG: thiolase family protein [Bdellovibrionia bacterium]